MSFINTATIQKPLPFNFSCSYCPLNKQSYCEGIDDLKKYSMEHPSLIGCYDVNRIKNHFVEIGERLISPPENFFQDKINFSELPLGVADGRIDLTQQNNIPLFVISMNDFIKNSGDIRFTDMLHLKKTFKLPVNSKVALIGTSSEKIQQAVWRSSEKFQIWKRIAEFGFEWATSLTFPVWDINPRSDQVIFQLRNYLTADLLASYGLPVIPFVYPYNETDYLTFKNWIKDRPSVNKIAIYARYYKTDEQFAQLLKNVERILDSAEREIQILMVGVIKKSKIRKVLSKFNNASIVSWSPYCEGYLKGKLYNSELISKQRLDIEKSEVIYRNYLTLSEVIKNLRVEVNNSN